MERFVPSQESTSFEEHESPQFMSLYIVNFPLFPHNITAKSQLAPLHIHTLGVSAGTMIMSSRNTKIYLANELCDGTFHVQNTRPLVRTSSFFSSSSDGGHIT